MTTVEAMWQGAQHARQVQPEQGAPGQRTVAEGLALARQLEAFLSAEGARCDRHQVELAHALMLHVVEILEEIAPRDADGAKAGTRPAH